MLKMEPEEQIKEIARILADSSDPKTANAIALLYVNIAEILYNAGYRKQSDKYYVAPGKTPVLIGTSENKQREWISVDERLPEKYGRYLVAFTDMRVDTATYTNKIGWFYERGCSITHWMPLPEPPVMKGGE